MLSAITQESRDPCYRQLLAVLCPGESQGCWSFSEAGGSSVYPKERGDIKHHRRDQKQGKCPETTSGKLYGKTATRKCMTVLEMEL